MSEEHKEFLRLVVEELKGIRASIAELKSDVNGIRVAIVEHTRDEEGRFDRVEATLTQHSSRLKDMEASLRFFRSNGS